jgi:carotenoid cleavage dioxygenase-like enzyme
MVTTVQPNTTSKTWAKAYIQPASEFGPTPLQVIAGDIPIGLRGSLYRNGPARLERGGQRVGHLFDGDGAILGLHFTDSGATGVYRYVQTEEYQNEEKAGKLIYGSYGRTPSGPIWKQLGIPMKNCANTGVLALPDKLLALWEAGLPHALDLETLATIGIDHLQGLEEDAPYSAHPKRDPQTGDIYNFGVTYGRKGTLNIYRSDYTGKIRYQVDIPIDGLPLIHDFVIAGQYLIFFIPPVHLNPLPFLAKAKSFSDSLSWQPNKGTQILVIDKDTLSVVSRGKTEPWFQWRFGNSYIDADGTAVVEVLRYQDFQINQFLKEVSTGKTQTAALGTLWQIRLNPQSGKVIQMQPVVNRSCEFPTLDPSSQGKYSRYTYLSVHRQGVDISQEMFNAIACFDYETGRLTEADFGQHRYPTGPIYAPDVQNPQQGWILTEVFDSDLCSSEIWIFDAHHLDAQPVCRLKLPSIVPFGFNGVWKSAH